MNYPSRIGIATLPIPTPEPETQPKSEPFDLTHIASAFKSITPTLLVVGIATGAAIAIGSGLVQYLLFRSAEKNAKATASHKRHSRRRS